MALEKYNGGSNMGKKAQPPQEKKSRRRAAIDNMINDLQALKKNSFEK